MPVASQAEPDPMFPTVSFPNPEEPGAMDAALELAEQTSPDVVIANDPDYMGDRTNGRVLNTIGFVYLVVLVLVSVATIPLMIITRGGS